MSEHENHKWDGDERRAVRCAAAPQHIGGVKFDATINLGHVLTFIGFVIAGFTAWSTLDKRLTVIEERATFQAQIDRQQDARLVETMVQIKEALGDLRSQVNRMSDRRMGGAP